MTRRGPSRARGCGPHQTDTEIRILKESVRARDGFRCTECGMSRESHVAQYGRDLDVHRITPGSRYCLEGCVTLCRRCHGPKPRLPRGTLPPSGVRMSTVQASVARQLDLLVERNESNFSQEVQRAILEYLERHELWPPR